MSHDMNDEPKRLQRHIQSIEVGFRLIAVLERARTKLTLKVIAEHAGMPASKAHLYMVSFSRLGLVAQDPVSLRYGLGPYAVQLGLAGLRQLEVTDVARDPMAELQLRSNLSVYLSVWGNAGPTIAAKFDGELEVPVAIKVGYVLPLLVSATGRVFLSLLPAAALASALKFGDYTQKEVDLAIKAAKKELAAHGVLKSDSRLYEGFASLSSPIFDNHGALGASMTLLGMRSRVDLNPNGTLARDLKATCAEVSRALGAASQNQPAIEDELRDTTSHRKPRRSPPKVS